MSYLIDTNVLIYAHRVESEWHEAAAVRLVALGEAVVVSPSCEVVQPGAEFMAWLLGTAREAGPHGNLTFDA